ncbi:Acyl-CoA dehydrogenase family member 11 [Neolecta irregularis DAH-3]|uniref:Acyl-CoA dehydrogenase family member 11 n=1 Tax=Neolecta irregularis (strain DAH-3) TaxID=1198029 RepID=A0A1U7LMP9_NEOID|nr:Acyl-CoA dehydrogenase family member 11 [Neolecta irregularis DAH-3]|eukprot:OLL23822.1 Acyl-CoA dehydrogenase family member 11 [Neolecta irregularis DAH-3]
MLICPKCLAFGKPRVSPHKASVRRIVSCKMSRAVSSSDSGFFQKPPVLTNQFTSDPHLGRILNLYVSHSVQQKAIPEFKSLGDIVVSEKISRLIENAERELPYVVQYDEWGRRIDKLVTSEGWRGMKVIACENGLVADGYDNEKWQGQGRLVQFIKVYLFNPSSATFTCPLSMTDGAAQILSRDPAFKEIFARLVSRDVSEMWTSGQWMTERTGGSDVSRTETQATKTSSGYSITGFKFFSSATDSDMALLLAQTPPSGLSLFYAPLRTASGQGFNGVRIHRLKNKLGTRPLPTAELELRDMKGELVGKEGCGVKNISSVLNITRCWNAISSISGAQRAWNIASAYAAERTVFGTQLNLLPTHLSLLSSMNLMLRGLTHLAFHTILFLGSGDVLLRLFAAVAKAYCAKKTIEIVSECLEACGGQGYMEETSLPRLYRDSQVLSIWEGTTNVLSSDVVKTIPKLVTELFAWAEKKGVRREMEEYLSRFDGMDQVVRFTRAREISFELAELLVWALVKEDAEREDAGVFERECLLYWKSARPQVETGSQAQDRAKIDYEIVYGRNPEYRHSRL